jgi:hypothetical protein
MTFALNAFALNSSYGALEKALNNELCMTIPLLSSMR